MGLHKGHTNNKAGRPKGTPNKTTGKLREMITGFLETNFETVLAEWAKMEGKDKLNFYKDLLKYALPTLQSIESKTEIEQLNDEQLDRILQELLIAQTNGQTTKN